MIFRHQVLAKTLEWTDNCHIGELVVENPKFLRELLQELSLVGDEKQISFVDQEKLLTLEKEIDVIFNLAKLDFNNRRALATLLKILVKTSLSEDFYLSTNKLKSRLVRYLDEIVDAEDFIFEIATDEFALDDLAKAMNIHINSDDEDFVEVLTDYFAMMTELAGIKIFVLINLRSLVAESELKRFCENLNNHQINVMLIENTDHGCSTEIPRIIVDKDCCEI